MASGAAPIPLGCIAKCTLECDIWVGSLDCEGVRWSVYGGLGSMVQLSLDGKNAAIEGEEVINASAQLSWGTLGGRRLCAKVAREGWNWEICAPNGAEERVALLGMMRGYSDSPPKSGVLKCDNTSC